MRNKKIKINLAWNKFEHAVKRNFYSIAEQE